MVLTNWQRIYHMCVQVLAVDHDIWSMEGYWRLLLGPARRPRPFYFRIVLLVPGARRGFPRTDAVFGCCCKNYLCKTRDKPNITLGTTIVDVFTVSIASCDFRAWRQHDDALGAQMTAYCGLPLLAMTRLGLRCECIRSIFPHLSSVFVHLPIVR